MRDSELASALATVADQFRSEPAPEAWRVAGKGAAMSTLMSPTFFGLAENLPGVHVGRTVYEPQFPTPAMGPARAALATRVLERLDRLNQRRGQLAEMIDRVLGEHHALALPRARSGAVPAWLRRPVLVPEPERRDELTAALQAAGIGATAMYPAPVHQIPGIEADLDLRGAPFTGAERLAASLIALPLVDSLTRADIDTIDRVVRAALGRRKADRWV